jgi:hypothetical protein
VAARGAARPGGGGAADQSVEAGGWARVGRGYDDRRDDDILG